MRRLILFVLIGGLGVWGLLRVSGGIDGPTAKRPGPAVEVTNPQADPSDAGAAGNQNDINIKNLGGPSIWTPGGANATIRSKTETLSWTDPATGDVLEIRGWFSWSFETGSFEGLPQGNDAGQGVLCKDVVLELYREPNTHNEALRRIEGDLRPVLHQRFTAKRARAFGSIAQKLNDKTGKRESAAGPDTRIQLLGDVVITDLSQSMRITGSELLVYPVQERVEGTGHFKVEHEAMTLTGKTLAMERLERGWTRVEIQEDTALHLHSDVRDASGKPMFNFGTGEFRPAHIHSDGRAIFVRETGRREERLRLTFPDGVSARQAGGRHLEAGWLEMLAIQDVREAASPTDESNPWTLRDLRADGGVRVEYPGESRKKKGQPATSFVTSIKAKRLTHIVPVEGRSRTELFGEPRIVVRGQLPIDDQGSPDDRLHIACRDRAWIEPLTSAEVDSGLDATLMQRMALRGAVRIERHTSGEIITEDFLEGDSIDLLLLEMPKETGPSQTVAVQFSANGDVRLGGSRIRGHTERLIAQGLHTAQPHIYAEGEGTMFSIPLVRRDQGLLGPEVKDDPAPSGSNPADTSAPDPGDAGDPANPRKVRWTLRRLLARGDVVVETQLGGASVGIPTRVTALEASYESEHRLARLNGAPGTPVRILSTVAPRETNLVEAQTMTLDRAQGIISARHGVRGELWVAEGGGFGPSEGERKPSKALEMSIRTDVRLDMHLVRGDGSQQPGIDQEQRLSVQGPLVVELKSENLTVDRLRALTLDIVLAAEPPATETPRSESTTPTARQSRGGSDETPPTTPTTRPARVPRSRIDVTARDVRVVLRDGEVAQLDASGGVDLKGKPGHVTGDRITYDAATHRIEISAGADAARRPATAYLGNTESRTEIEGARLGLLWIDNSAQAADATAPAGRKSRIRLYRRDPKEPDRQELFELRYEGTVHLNPNGLTASRVIVIRSARNLRTQAVEAPAALYTSSLEVFGTNLLSREAVSITRLLAQGEGTYFRSGKPGDGLLEAWGQSFDYDVTSGMARLTGTPQDEVVLRRGGDESYFPVLLFDVPKGLPFAPDGTYIVLRKKKR